MSEPPRTKRPAAKDADQVLQDMAILLGDVYDALRTYQRDDADHLTPDLVAGLMGRIEAALVAAGFGSSLPN